MEAADDEPEELVSSAQARTALGAEGDLELLAEEQVLDEQRRWPATESASEGGQEKAPELDHPQQDRRSSPAPPRPQDFLPSYNPTVL